MSILDTLIVRERRSPPFQPWGLEAIRAGRKTMTRRICKLQPHPHGHPGDVWALGEPLQNGGNGLAYYADWEACKDRRLPKLAFGNNVPWQWKALKLPGMYMPLWAARDFVTLTAVRVERLQDISRKPDDILAEGLDVPANLPEGCERGYDAYRFGYEVPWIELWDSINAKPKPVYQRGCKHFGPLGGVGVCTGKFLDHYISYPWEDVQETREYRGKPWFVRGNPWVWVYVFGDYVRELGRPMTEVRR